MYTADKESNGPDLQKKIRAVVCPMLINLCIGSYYCFSNINPYVSAYLNSRSEEEVLETDTLLVMPVWLVTQSVFAILSVRIAEKVGYWNLNLASFILFALVNLLASFTTSVFQLVFVYGFLTGITIGCGYLPALFISWTYFPNHKSVVTGAILFWAGLSGVILGPLTTSIANPNDIEIRRIRDSPEVYENVPKLFRYLSMYFGTITLVSCLLQPGPYSPEATAEDKVVEYSPRQGQTERKSFKDITGSESPRVIRYQLGNQLRKGSQGHEAALLMGQLDDQKLEELAKGDDNVKSIFRLVIRQIEMQELGLARRESEHKTIVTAIEEEESKECPSMKAAIMSNSFIHLCAIAYLCSMYNYFLNAVWKKFFPTLFEVKDSDMGWLLSIGAFSNSIFRLLVGLLLLKYPFKYILLANALSATISSWTVNHLATSYPVGVIYIIFEFGGFGTNSSLLPNICLKVFGPSIGPKIYPCVYLMFSLASLTQYMVLKLAGPSPDWLFLCRLLGSITFAGFILAVYFKPERDWTPEINSEKAGAEIHDEK